MFVDKFGHDMVWIVRWREIVVCYDVVLFGIGTILVGVVLGCLYVFYKYVVRSLWREALRVVLIEVGIVIVIYYLFVFLCHLLFASVVWVLCVDAVCGEVLLLLIHVYLTDGEVEWVCVVLARV